MLLASTFCDHINHLISLYRHIRRHLQILAILEQLCICLLLHLRVRHCLGNLLLLNLIIFLLFLDVQDELGDFEGYPAEPDNIAQPNECALFGHEFDYEPQVIVNDVVFILFFVSGLE